MHGYKKPKSNWEKKKNKKNNSWDNFDSFKDSEKNKKKNKKLFYVNDEDDSELVICNDR